MANLKQATEDHLDIFDFDSDETIENHGRKSVRYVRHDIKVVLIVSTLLGIDKKLKAELQDVSSNGIRISTQEQLRPNKKLTVALKFKDGTRFTIKARVVRKSLGNPQDYGIKFDQRQNDLAEHLLETQTDLLFK